MTEFQKIETQAQLDTVIKDRLARQKETLESQFKDYDQLKARNTELEAANATLQTTVQESTEKVKGYDQNVADLNSKIAGYETANLRTQVALKNGLPFDLADRLVGTDEASLTADAERLAGFVKAKAPVPPLKDTEGAVGGQKDGAYKNLLENLNTDEE